MQIMIRFEKVDITGSKSSRAGGRISRHIILISWMPGRLHSPLHALVTSREVLNFKSSICLTRAVGVQAPQPL